MTRIRSWMNDAVITVRPRDSVLHARELLERHRINQLPVTVDGTLVGIVTDRDLRDAFPSVFLSMEPRRRWRRTAGTHPVAIPVQDVMTTELLTLNSAAPVAEAARLMRLERIGAVPIVDGGHLVGILTRSDVLDAYVEMSRTVRLLG